MQKDEFPKRRTSVRLVLLSVIVTCVGGVIVWLRWQPVIDPDQPVVQRTGPRVNCVSVNSHRSGFSLAAVDTKGRLRLWEVKGDGTRQEIPIKLPSEWPLHDLAWLVDGTVITGGFERHVLGWNRKSQRAVKLPPFAAEVVSLAAHPTKPEFLISLSDGTLHKASLTSSELQVVPNGHRGIVKVVRYRPDGERFVTAGADRQLIWHKSDTLSILKSVTAHENEVSSIAFDSTGTYLASGSWDNTVKIWKESDWSSSQSFVHPDGIAHVDWLSSDLISTCWDQHVRVWSTSSGLVIGEQPWKIDSLAFAIWPGERRIVGVKPDGEWHIVTP